MDQPVKDWEPGTSACLRVSFQSVPVTLCPFLFDWIPVTITKVFTPPPNSPTSLPQTLVAPCRYSGGQVKKCFKKELINYDKCCQ